MTPEEEIGICKVIEGIVDTLEDMKKSKELLDKILTNLNDRMNKTYEILKDLNSRVEHIENIYRIN